MATNNKKPCNMADKNLGKITKLPEVNPTLDDEIELEKSIVKIKEDKEAKCKSAKEQLVKQLGITMEKYRTATGTAEALRTLRFVAGSDEVNLSFANKLALKMAGEVSKMKTKAKNLSYAKMDTLCDGFYDKEFKIVYPAKYKAEDLDNIENEHVFNMAFEMMRIDLCRNVGGSAEDMVEFIKRTQKEIDACGEKLKELKAKKED